MPSIWFLQILLLHLLLLFPHSISQPETRQIWVWANGNDESAEAQIRQLNNVTWSSMIDGIQAWCGCYFSDRGLKLNQTAWANCKPLFQAAKNANTKFQLVISGSIPQNAPVEMFLTDALALHHHLHIDGFSIDDERDCAPRASTSDFVAWTLWQSRFAQGLEPYDIYVTSAIQAVFGINQEPGNLPCARNPSDYPMDPQVVETLQTATLQRWLVMDTYYFSTGRFLGALDWHVRNVRSTQCFGNWSHESRRFEGD